MGRDDELAILDEAWSGDGTKVVEIVAWGGVGKSALLNRWVGQMATGDFRGAERVYAWSFYSQGTSDNASSDQFVAAALEWFGDPDPTQGSPWEKGERLANLVRRQPTLLILDGMEPLQTPPGIEEGRLRDPAVESLLRELAVSNPGLCVITSRIKVTDLDEMVGTAVRLIALGNLPPEAGAQLLRELEVEGTYAELEDAVKEFGGHALALSLLGSLLRDRHGGDVRRWRELPPLATSDAQGAHARRVMESYVTWFRREYVGSQRGFLARLRAWLAFSNDPPETTILRILGLFNRPADGPAIEALRRPPAIRGLTDAVMDIDETRWAYAISRLHRAGLVAQVDPARPDALDAHPLVREHFGEQLKQEHPRAWREANGRLYEHYRDTAKPLPDTIDEMQPLYQAVAHGCAAERYQEALGQVYYPRIQRGTTFFSSQVLGAIGANLAILSGFFETPWGHPTTGLDDARQAYVLNQAGYSLRAMGRLREAAVPMLSGLEMHKEQEDWRNAASAAGNLSELHVTTGELREALRYGERAVELADRSEDESQRCARRATWGDALHQVGRLDEAEVAFKEAEKMQPDYDPQHPLLYSLRGSQYCDLLLGTGEHEAVLERATLALELATNRNHLLQIGLDNLSLGRAHMMKSREEGSRDFSQATQHLDQAVQGLRDAGQQDYLVPGLLARGDLRLITVALPDARRDLGEAMTIAERGGMRRHEADCHLGYARLALAEGHHEKAREHLDRAKTMIDDMDYHRRDPEVVELDNLIDREPSQA